MLRKLALLATSTLLTLLVVEGAIRLGLVPLPGFLISDAWGRERFLQKQEGLNPREFVALDAELGWVPAPDLDGLVYDGVPVGTNASGERGRKRIPTERSGRARVVAVGDSFTFGQCVGDADTYPAAMERALRDTDVVNLGVMGYGHDQALLRLRRDGLPYRPDAVVLGFHSTDVARNWLRFFSYAKPRFVQTPDGLALDNVPVPPPESFVGLWPPRMLNYALMARDWAAHELGDVRQQSRQLSAEIVYQMARELEALGIPLYVLHLPHPADLQADGPYGWRWMTRFCEGEKPVDFHCIPTVPRFRELLPTPEDVTEHFRCHFSPLLQEAAGFAAARALAEAHPERFMLRAPVGSGVR